MSDQTVYTGGICYIREKGNLPWFDMGEVDTLALAHDREKKSLPTNRTCAGGNRNSFFVVNGVDLSLKMLEFDANNLNIGLFANSATVVAGTIADEEHDATGGGFVKFVYPPSENITIEDTAGGGGVTYAEGTDYEIRTGGINVVSGGAISGVIYANYDHDGLTITQALTEGGKEYEFLFDGLNKASNCDPFTLEVFRFKPGIAETLELITGEYMGMDLSGEILVDEAKTGTNESQYYTITQKTPV